MFGFSKVFAIVLLIAIIFSFGLKTAWMGVQIVIGYALVKIIWNIFTK